MSDAIRIRSLHKTFGPVRALDGLDLTVSPGEVHGFLGPNGAGKTTTLRILLGLLRADSGSVEVLGRDPWADRVDLHRHLAYVPGDVELWPGLTGGEIIDVLSGLRGGVDRARVDELCQRFDLDPTRKARTYSKGNRQKVALVAALVAEVDLLVLDEPTTGLDPLMETVFQQCVNEARAAGRTVLLSSHILAQVEVLADRLSIVRGGRTVETGVLRDLQHVTGTDITVATNGSLRGLADLPGVHDLSTVGDRTRFVVDDEHLDSVMARLGALGVTSLVARPPTLEQILLRHYGHELAGAGADAGSGGTSAAGAPEET